MLSKSDYMLYLKHPAWLWLKKNDPEKLKPVDPALQEQFNAGYEFEECAEQLYSNAIRISLDNSNNFSVMENKTADAWKDNAKCVCQGMYSHGEIYCITDILEYNGSAYNLTEIKSSAKAKPEHVWDLAFQKIVLERAGYNVDKCIVAHVNNNYMRTGQIDPHKIVKKTDVTVKVEKKLKETEKNIKNAVEILRSNSLPDHSPLNAGLGSFSEWLEIRRGLEPKLEKDSIYNLPHIGARQAKNLSKLGISKISKINDASVLSDATSKYWTAKSKGQRWINQPKLFNYLEKINYPIYYLDYETSQSIFPIWENTHPYQQVPFQYSLHVKETPTSDIKHCDYLHRSNENPILSLLDKLSKDIGNSGTVFVWHARFESSRNNEMGKFVSKYTDFLSSINKRIVDLEDPFKFEYITDPAFEGKSSIKKILPAMINNFSYEDLDIKEGLSAGRLWKEATFNKISVQSREKIYSDLELYCERDTYAMVLIHEELNRLLR